MLEYTTTQLQAWLQEPGVIAKIAAVLDRCSPSLDMHDKRYFVEWLEGIAENDTGALDELDSGSPAVRAAEEAARHAEEERLHAERETRLSVLYARICALPPEEGVVIRTDDITPENRQLYDDCLELGRRGLLRHRNIDHHGVQWLSVEQDVEEHGG